MYIAKGAEQKEIIHEIGHMVEKKLVSAGKVSELKKKWFSNVSSRNIRSELYEDTEHHEIKIFVLKSEHLVSEYQGRIYAETMEEAFDADGRFKDELMLEFISEPFREYMEKPEDLRRKSPELYQMIREVVT